MYEGGSLRVIIDDAKVGNHKRFRTSTMMGFEYLSLKAEMFNVVERSEEKIIIETIPLKDYDNQFSHIPSDCKLVCD